MKKIKEKVDRLDDCKPSDFKGMLNRKARLTLTAGPKMNRKIAQITVTKEFFKLPEDKQQNILSAFYHLGLEWELHFLPRGRG